METTSLPPSSPVRLAALAAALALAACSTGGGGVAPGAGVESTSPAAGEQGVDPSSVLLVVFEQSLDTSALHAGWLTLTSEVGPATGTISVEGGAARRLVLVPDHELEAGLEYTATVSGMVRFASGDLLGADHAWSFAAAGEGGGGAARITGEFHAPLRSTPAGQLSDLHLFGPSEGASGPCVAWTNEQGYVEAAFQTTAGGWGDVISQLMTYPTDDLHALPDGVGGLLTSTGLEWFHFDQDVVPLSTGVFGEELVQDGAGLLLQQVAYPGMAVTARFDPGTRAWVDTLNQGGEAVDFALGPSFPAPRFGEGFQILSIVHDGTTARVVAESYTDAGQPIDSRELDSFEGIAALVPQALSVRGDGTCLLVVAHAVPSGVELFAYRYAADGQWSAPSSLGQLSMTLYGFASAPKCLDERPGGLAVFALLTADHGAGTTLFTSHASDPGAWSAVERPIVHPQRALVSEGGEALVVGYMHGGALALVGRSSGPPGTWSPVVESGELASAPVGSFASVDLASRPGGGFLLGAFVTSGGVAEVVTAVVDVE